MARPTGPRSCGRPGDCIHRVPAKSCPQCARDQHEANRRQEEDRRKRKQEELDSLERTAPCVRCGSLSFKPQIEHYSTAPLGGGSGHRATRYTGQVVCGGCGLVCDPDPEKETLEEQAWREHVARQNAEKWRLEQERDERKQARRERLGRFLDYLKLALGVVIVAGVLGLVGLGLSRVTGPGKTGWSPPSTVNTLLLGGIFGTLALVATLVLCANVESENMESDGRRHLVWIVVIPSVLLTIWGAVVGGGKESKPTSIDDGPPMALGLAVGGWIGGVILGYLLRVGRWIGLWIGQWGYEKYRRRRAEKQAGQHGGRRRGKRSV